ncbi:hypothetical protein JRJ22_19955 [Paenibacillus tianjinensis]|uniref:Uncharacterized protein n=1 Tax=Paenibacillus tianjinensis TaxID=2810347 RepID=A0ABX7LLK3_9BACL|nr:hypothetical protein JRJ22_19955 [Paenibacillus tianjinensis]
MDLGRYGSRELLKLQIFDFGATPTPRMYFDYSTGSSDETASDRVFAIGGSGGVRRIKFDGSKTKTLTVETQIFTMDHLAMLAGNPIVSGEKDVYKTQIVTVESDGSSGKQVTLDKSPVGASLTFVYKFVNGVKTGSPATITSVTTNVVKFTAADIAIGDEVEVYYKTTVASTHSVNYTTKGFPGYVKLVGDSVYADEVAGELVPVQKVYHKASLQPNYTVTHNATGDPSVLTLVFDLFPIKVDGEDSYGEEIIYDEA